MEFGGDMLDELYGELFINPEDHNYKEEEPASTDMEFQEVQIRGITLKVWYIFNEHENSIEIHSIQHEYIEMYDFCEWYNVLPDIYSELWKHI